MPRHGGAGRREAAVRDRVAVGGATGVTEACGREPVAVTGHGQCFGTAAFREVACGRGEGRWLGDVTVPARPNPADVGPDRGLASWTDECDVERVGLYTIEKRGW